MIFADKLILLRKNNGWSQEELAELMGVTRQSVSKWEGAQSIPDLEKMIKLSELFSVSTDFLLKDELESSENVKYSTDDVTNVVSVEEANKLILITEKTSKINGFATFLCIISPICLFVLSAFAESDVYSISENAAQGIGMIVLLLFITIASLLFLSSNSKTSSFDYLEKETISLEYGVKGIVQEKKNSFKPIYEKNNRLGTLFCIISVIPLFVSSIINDTDEILQVSMFSIVLILAGIGVYFFVYSGSIWASYNKILQLEDYSVEKKKISAITTPISIIYWLIVFALIVAYSIITGQRKESGIFLIIGAILYPALLSLINLLQNKKNR